MRTHLRSKGLILTAATGFGFLFMPVAQAEYDHSGDGVGKDKKWEQKVEKFHKDLGLTPQQEQQLKAQREQYRAQKQALFGQIKEKTEQMQAELQKPDMNEAKVKQLHAELQSLRSKAADTRLDSVLAVRQVLTPEQFQKFNEKKQGFRGGWHEGKEKHRGMKHKE